MVKIACQSDRTVREPTKLCMDMRRGHTNYQALAEAFRKVRAEINTVEVRMAATPSASADSMNHGSRAGFLQKLALPTFSGDHLDYPGFKQTFLALMRPMKLEDPVSLEHRLT